MNTALTEKLCNRHRGSNARRLLTVVLTATIFSFAASSQSYSQTLHAVVIGDVSPSAGWGKYTMAVAMDMRLVYSMLYNSVPERQLNLVQLEIEEDEWSSPRNLLDSVRELKVNPGDILLFYFSGHGAADDRGHYLDLAMGKLYREELLKVMEEKRPRLAVLITDCCNTRSDGYRYGAPYIHTENPRSPTPLFRSLYFEPTGRVDINSSAPSESAFFIPIVDDDDNPALSSSIFTGELVNWTDENRNRRTTWDTLVSALGLRVHATFTKYYPNGAEVAKGGVIQKRQDVHAYAYPGYPEAKGPRTGMVIRDFGGRGAVIVEVAPSSPAASVYRLDIERLVPLETQQVVFSVNDIPTSGTEEVVKALGSAPQISKLGIRDRMGRSFDVLIRMRY